MEIREIFSRSTMRAVWNFLRTRIVSPWAVVRLGILAACIYAFFDPIVRMNMFPWAGTDELLIDPLLRQAYSAEHLTLATEAGDRISALRFRGGTGALALYFHGNAEQLATAQYQLAEFADRGLDVLALDYPGYGESTGTPTLDANLAAARALYDYGTRSLGYPPERIIYVGYSVGTAVAVALASERPPAGLALFAPFTSDRDMARTMFGFDLYRFFGQDSRYPSLATVERMQAPLLVTQGTDDEVIPYRMGEETYAHAGANRKWFVGVPEVGHNDLFDHLDTTEFRGAMDAFLLASGIPANNRKND